MNLKCVTLLATAVASLSLSLTVSCVYGRPRVSYAYLGCYLDNATQRDLNGLAGLTALSRFAVQPSGAVWNSSAMSLGMCSEICSIGGFGYFGIHSGAYCYCGNSYGSHGTANASECNKSCVGDASQICGGGIARSSVYAMTYVYQTNGRSCRQIFSIQSPKQYLSLQQTTNPDSSGLTVRPAAPVVWNVTASSLLDCPLRCNANSCQGYMFWQDRRICYLMKFSAIPSSLSAAVSGNFYVRI